MRKFVPVLRAVLVGCIGLLAIIFVLNLAFGERGGAGRVAIPLLFGLYAFAFIGRANLASATCPTCATEQPRWRKPSSFRQLMFGGWTCANCGAGIDRHGKAIERKA